MKKLMSDFILFVTFALQASEQPVQAVKKSTQYAQLLKEYFGATDQIARREVLNKYCSITAKDRKLLKTNEELAKDFDNCMLPHMGYKSVSEIKRSKKEFMAEKQKLRKELQASIGAVAKSADHIKQTIVFKYSFFSSDENVRGFSPRYAFLWGLSSEQIKEHQAWKHNGTTWVQDEAVQQVLNASKSAAAKK